MIGALFRGLFWFVAAMILFAILVTHAQAQPPTYLPWQAGATYRISQGNWYGGHVPPYNTYAWDFEIPSGTPVLAAAAGSVAEARFAGNAGWGNTVLVCYGDATCSRYAHLSSINVGAGQAIGRGQMVGRVGSTGNSTGPHLHYQLESRGRGSVSIPSSFAEAGVPGAGQWVTSRNPGGDLGTYKGAVNAQFPMDRNGVVTVAQGEGAKVNIGYNLWNNGTRTWGDARLVLVNDPPENLRKTLGWETLSSIPGDRQRVEPGTGTQIRFQVKPEEINPPGDYPFKFRVLDRTSGEYIPGLLPSFVLRIRPACYAAAFDGQSVSPITAPGQSGAVEIRLRNTGRCAWQKSGPEPVRLGTREPRDGNFPFADGSWISPSRMPLVEGSVAPGQVGHFRATFRVPPGQPTGRVRQYFAPLAEGTQWFATHLGAHLDFFVGDAWHLPWFPGEYSAPWVSQTYAGPLKPGQTATVSVTFRNSGRAVLFNYGPHPVRLRGIRERDRESAFIDRTSPLAVGTHNAQGVKLQAERVDPGELFTFTMPIRVASGVPPGRYKEYFRPLAEGLTWFGPDDVFWPFTVTK